MLQKPKNYKIKFFLISINLKVHLGLVIKCVLNTNKLRTKLFNNYIDFGNILETCAIVPKREFEQYFFFSN